MFGVAAPERLDRVHDGGGERPVVEALGGVGDPRDEGDANRAPTEPGDLRGERRLVDEAATRPERAAHGRHRAEIEEHVRESEGVDVAEGFRARAVGVGDGGTHPGRGALEIGGRTRGKWATRVRHSDRDAHDRREGAEARQEV